MSTGHAGHDQRHGMARQTLRLAFFLSLLILAAELGGGLLSHSLALLSDAGHVLTDLFALGLAWFATGQAERPADARKTFGYHRVGILAALVNALTLILIALWILWEAVQRLQHPEPIQPLVMFLSAGIGIAVNLSIGFGLRKESANLNVRAATLHVFGDVGASLGVVVAGLVIVLTGWTLADSLLSVGIAGLIAVGAWRLLREATTILLEASPQGISMPDLVQDLKGVPGIVDVHDLHVWSITSGMNALSCHALICDQPASASAVILHDLERMLARRYRIGHTTIQLECDAHQERSCLMDGLYCQMEAAAAGVHDHQHDAHQCHDEQAHLQAEGGSIAEKGDG